ncbi:hypothetical protein [Microvirga mediterraneensis]|uniref:Uncharacterized protein n=1 Tax=Microvirga mediterraneensis TaxID=2754695 RepID=A0A838BPR5_9HYPH|nr:hypothetical protein [Microvirga mediterraneensis]MBA1156892.1 hypothetical protein [Microvirga mediterraneensis]MBA1157805.1 hypothetical protein [Microvirga mediterraneensis]
MSTTETEKTLPPGDVEKVIARLRGFRSINEWGDPCHHTELDAIADQFASLLTTSTEGNKRLRVENERLRADLHDECFEHGKVIAQRDASQSQAEAMKAALEESAKIVRAYEDAKRDWGNEIERLQGVKARLEGELLDMTETASHARSEAKRLREALKGEMRSTGLYRPSMRQMDEGDAALSIKGGESNGR